MISEQEGRSPAGELETRGTEALGAELEATLHEKRMTLKMVAGRMAKAMEKIVTIGLLLMLMLAAFLAVAPRFGMKPYSVQSGSMEPNLKVGGLVICKSVPVEGIVVGDIMVANDPDGVSVCHRVIDIREEEGRKYFQTKGDANEDPDVDRFSINADKVDKVVVHLPYLGFFHDFMQTRLAFFLLVLAPALILITLFGKEMWAAVSEFREGRKIKANGSDERIPGESGEDQSS